MHPNKLPIEYFNVPSNSTGRDWFKSLPNIKAENKMIIPVESVGVSFTSKVERGVTISPSVFDFQSANTIQGAIKWMGFKDKLNNISTQWGGIHNDGGKLAEQLMRITMDQGNPLDRGDTGLMRLVLENGAMPDNFLVVKQLRRLLRSNNMKELSKASHLEGGEANFIAPNWDGGLSTPLFAKIWKKSLDFTGEYEQVNRAVIQYGGIGINRNVASRLMGGAKNNATLEGEFFVMRNEHGVDEVIDYNNGKLTYSSSFYSKNVDSFRQENYFLRDSGGSDIGNIEATSKSTKSSIKNLLESISILTRKYNLQYGDVFDLLNGEQVVKRNTSTGVDEQVKLSDSISKIASKFKVQLGTFDHAIPVIGHDKAIMRVEKIDSDLLGLVEVNAHDLRTILQRDHDGDKLYTHTRMPYPEILRSFVREGGKKDDFYMFKTQDVLNSDYINILGVGTHEVNGRLVDKVGINSEKTGFHDYASVLTQAKMNIGGIIGTRNALSWLSRLGFDYKIDGAQNPLMRDILKDGRMSEGSWRFLDKFYDIIQNSVDIHGGIPDIMRNKRVLMDFIFFNELPAAIRDKVEVMKKTGEVDEVFLKHYEGIDNTIIEPRIKGYGSKEIEKEMFYLTIDALKKVKNPEKWAKKSPRSLPKLVDAIDTLVKVFGKMK